METLKAIVAAVKALVLANPKKAVAVAVAALVVLHLVCC